MPVVHQYKNRRGFYIKANQGGKITTYQVTEAGAAVLKGRGQRDGSSLSPAELARLREQGYVTTGGSGPGEMEPAAPAVSSPPPPPAPKKDKLSRRERKRQRQAAWHAASPPYTPSHIPSYSPPVWGPPSPPPPVPPPAPVWVPPPDDTEEEWLVLSPLDPEPTPRSTDDATTGRATSGAETLPLDLASPDEGVSDPPLFPLLASESRPASSASERSPVAAAPLTTEPPPARHPAAPGQDARRDHPAGKLPGPVRQKAPPRRGPELAAGTAAPRRPMEREEPKSRSAVKWWLALALAVLLVFPAWLLVAGLLALLLLPKDASLAVKVAVGAVVVGTAVGAAVLAYRSERE